MPESRSIPASVVEGRVQELDARIQELERSITGLQVERDVYRSLLNHAVLGSPPASPPTGHHYGTPSKGQTTSLTDQLIAYVTEHPGMISGQIADDLIAGGFASGQNPRKNILTTLAFVASKERLRKEADGRHYAIDYPVQQPSLLAADIK